MARPKNQARRRSELVAVTAKLLIEKGATGARLVDIAEAAQLTPASVSYYYPDLIDLYAETFETAAVEYITGRRARVEAVTGPIARLRECLRLGIPVEGEPSFDATVLLIELGALSARNRGFDAAANEFERAQVEVFEQLIVEGVEAGLFEPKPDAAHVARTLLAIEDGLAQSTIRGALTPDAALDTISGAAGVLLGREIPAA